jgi:hypothetical protein
MIYQADVCLMSGAYFEKSILHGLDYTRRGVHCNSRYNCLRIRLVLESVH